MEVVSSLFSPCLNLFHGFSLLHGYLPTNFGGEEVHLGDRSFKILRLLGEGGYSFVYLAREIPSVLRPEAPDTAYALKKVIAATGDQLRLANREVDVMKRLHHPNLLPLLTSSVSTLQDDERGIKNVIYMLFPLCELGSVFDEVTRLQKVGSRLPTYEILDIFLQVCLGVQHMHQMSPPLAHRDIKPHNVLLQRRQQSSGFQEASQPARRGSASAGAPSDTDGKFSAVLMDFGSTRTAHFQISSRAQALELQEDAEAHCTQPYKAPELFDVPSQCTVDERVDIWSLGCLLYFMMFGVSPFERVLTEAGGSLALAVSNGRVSWPKEEAANEDLRALVLLCLDANPQTRPFIDEVIRQTRMLLSRRI